MSLWLALAALLAPCLSCAATARSMACVKAVGWMAAGKT